MKNVMFRCLPFLLLALIALSSAASTPCPNMDGQPSCFDCTMTSTDPSIQCGFCAPTLECLVGNVTGPTGGFCNGGWYFAINDSMTHMLVSTCPACSSSRSCLECNENPDCAWCGSNNTCYAVEDMPPTCMAVHSAGCPCEERTQCSDCVQGTQCVFCGAPDFRCVAATSGKCSNPMKIDNCTCSSFQDCNSCQEQEPCFWCAKSKQCQFYGETTCAATVRYCSSLNSGKRFSGGSFIGGMLTVIGILALGGLIYFGYGYYKSQQSGYESIQH